MEEFIDEVDGRGNTLGKHPVSELKTKMFMHKVVLIIPKSADGKLLLCRRAKTKELYPDTWCCAVGGKVSSGETEEQAATREMAEEVGKPYPVVRASGFVYDKPDYKAIFTIFTTDVPIPESELVLDPKEIQYVKAFSKAELKKMISEDPGSFAATFIAALRASIDVL